MKKLIKNGTLVTAENSFRSDILIEDEKIIQIGTDIVDDQAEVIDATGKLVLPGGIDPMFICA